MWWAELRDRVTPSQAMPLRMGCCPLVSEAGRQVTGFSDNSDMASVQLGAAGDRLDWDSPALSPRFVEEKDPKVRLETGCPP